MEVDENLDDVNSNTDQMWGLLVSTFSPSIAKREKKDFIELNKVLKMMKSLTYENPGIFILKFLSLAEQKNFEFRYMWLLNKLLFIATNDEHKM